MYTFVTATCLSRTIGAQWKEEPQLNAAVVYTIFQNFSEVYLTVTHPDVDGQLYVSLAQLKEQYSAYAGTLSDLLTELGDRTLETVATIPSTVLKYAKYSDAVRVGYKIQTTVRGIEVPPNFPDAEKHDLEITRPIYSTDMELLHRYSLVSVNGYYHMTDAVTEKAYVLKGGDTMRLSNNNHLGIWSFLDVGELKKIPIDIANIRPAEGNLALKDKIQFSINEDLQGKSFFLILGGYIIFPQDQVFWQVNDNSFNLDINKLPYAERIFESKWAIDLSSLNLTQVEINPDYGFLVSELYSDDVIKKYMTLSQSFMVVIDIPNLSLSKIFMRNSGLPGMFTAYQDPVCPLIVGYGRVAEYWKTFEDGYWSVTVQDSFHRNYIATKKPLSEQEVITNNLVPMKPYFDSPGYLLQLAGFE